MFRKPLIAAIIMMFGVTVAAAEGCDDVVKTRQTLMKRSGAEAKVGSQMIRGEIPFDLAKTKEIFAAFADDAGQMPSLFPDCSRTGANTGAAAAIWEKPDDFKALVARFAADIKAGEESTKDVDTLKAAFQTIGRDCGACHRGFVLPGRAP